MNTIKIIYILFILSLFSCSSVKNNVSETEILETEISTLDSTSIQSKIIFLIYKISKVSTDKVVVSLINKILVEGEIKPNLHEYKTPKTGDLICSQLDENSLSIQDNYIAYPLSKGVEYVDDTGQFQTKLVELDSAEFTIRLQLNPAAKFIRIEQKGISDIELLKTKL